ncbi:MAG: sporulation protein [Oscillospiraceae bacterium]|nr:sporulation protein [Oscillospiraceae bacterium]
MKKHSFSYLSVSFVLISLAAFILAPDEVSHGARNGLSVCAGVIIPNLMPFLVLSSLAALSGVPQIIAKLSGRIMEKLFSVSGLGCTPLILGFTGGYPVGAASIAQLVREGQLSRDDGERLLPFCNNTGPAFIIGAAGAGVFHSTQSGIILYLSHITAALIVGIFLSFGKKKIPAPPLFPFERKSFAEALPESIRHAVATTVNICGYVVFFSVLTALLDSAGFIHGLAGSLSLRLGIEIAFVRSLLVGILELGSGIGSMSGLLNTPLNLALASFILGFGSLSVHCQTLAVLSGTKIKCARHFVGRILIGLVSAFITLAFSTLLQN